MPQQPSTPANAAAPPVRRGENASEPREHGATFWIGLLIGGGVVAFGIRGALMEFDTASERFAFVKYLIGFDFIHDLVIAPVAFLIGFAVHRVVPSRYKAPLTFALFTSAIAIAVAWYPLQHTAANKGNSSFQPLHYGTAVATVIGVVWTIAVAWAILVSRPRGAPKL